MASIPLPALAVRPPQVESPIDTYSKILSLKSLIGQQQLQQQQIQAGQYELGARQAIDQSFQNAVKVDPGSGMPTFDTQAITQGLAAKGYGSKVPGIVKSLTDAQQSAATLQKTKDDVTTQFADYAGHLAYAAHQANDDPQVLMTGLQHAAALGDKSATQAMQVLQQDPSKAPVIIQGLMYNSPAISKMLNDEKIANIRAATPDKQEMAAWLKNNPIRPDGTPTDASDYQQFKVNQGVQATVSKETNPQVMAARVSEAGRSETARIAAQTASANVQQQGKMLVEGQLDPSQLQKRGATYGAILSAADQYSQQTYGQPFNVAKATQDYKFAGNVGTQNTLKYLNSLTGANGKPGNLDTLINISNGIQRTSFPALNDTAAWARLQTGDPAMAQYHAALTEVSDQVAKILQGGGSGTSDAKLRQAQELFNSGFSKPQIQAVASTLRDLLSNRKRELVGDNTYLQRQYGSANSAPQGQPVYVQGKLVGYTTDGKTMTPAQ